MPYRIKKPTHLAKEFQRIAREQVDRAIAEIEDPSLDEHETVHQVRKRCKKIRGLLRLTRDPLDADATFSRENAHYRDAARNLSHIRDAKALIETYDRLMEHYGEQVERSTFGGVRRQLTLRLKDLASDQDDLDRRLAGFRNQLTTGRKTIPTWTNKARRFRDLLPGLTKTYRRAREAMAVAYHDPLPEHFHEWRKRTKYHRYHTRLLRDVWRPVMQARRDELSRLSDLLGDAHDLSVFRSTLSANPGDFGDKKTLDALLGLIDRRRQSLRETARPLGARLFAEKPEHFARRIKKYAKATRLNGPS